MKADVPPGICPNCGSNQGQDDDGFCVSCWWQEGDDFFKPHWMTDENWRIGIQLGWNEAAIKAVKMKRKRK